MPGHIEPKKIFSIPKPKISNLISTYNSSINVHVIPDDDSLLPRVPKNSMELPRVLEDNVMPQMPNKYSI